MEFSRDVDVVVGAQYGDEGKGMIAKLLADKAEASGDPYRWTARVGAQNAEHRFIHQGCSFTARVMPSAAAYRKDIWAVLGAGHCFMPEHLFLEAVHLGIPLERVFVDPQAMWLKPEHSIANLDVANARASTGWGVGKALAEKVRRAPGTQLIGDNWELREALGDRLTSASALLQGAAGPGLLEGSQGALLSLNHGHYPYCTGKDVSVPALCAELGINRKRVRRVVGVIRAVPMRVSGPSGPTGGKEVSYNAIEDLTGLRLPQHRRLQGDSMRWRARNQTDAAEEERLFELSMEEVLLSHRLNGYDEIVLTFADYHRPGNYRVHTWGELHPDTQALVRRLEAEVAPVILVRTGQGEDDNIWLDGGAA